jgi:hypothetical protein
MFFNGANLFFSMSINHARDVHRELEQRLEEIQTPAKGRPRLTHRR